MMAMVVKIYNRDDLHAGRPLAGFWIHAGFESPGTDYKEGRITLENYVSTHPNALYYIRVTGGLYLSEEIIRSNEGHIGVESKVGEGSTFYFELPLSK